jgi:hypothetical protein
LIAGNAAGACIVGQNGVIAKKTPVAYTTNNIALVWIAVGKNCKKCSVTQRTTSMKVTVKKNLIIFHNPEEWQEISSQLVQEFGPSILISWKTKRELGFQVRYHQGLVKRNDQYVEVFNNQYFYQDQVCLDFFTDAAQSWFQLRYL